MNPLPAEPGSPSRTQADRGFQKAILRLVKSGPERQAIEAGQVDAIVDPASGTAILLPDAQRALHERNAGRYGLIALAFDWIWEQDVNHRFVSHTSIARATSGFGGDSIIGKALWELPIGNMSETDWDVHRQQLAWHATFHDLEVRCLNHEGQAHLYAVSGEARYDDNHQFKGYHGIVRNIGARPRPALSDPEHGDLFRRGFDGIASPVCLLNCYGTVLLANAAWRIFASTRTGIGAGVYEGSNYLAALEAAAAGQKIDAIAIAAGIRQVIAGEREVYRYDCEFPAPAASTGGHWYALCATQAADTDPACVVVALEDRTAHKHAERLLKLELAVAQGLAAAGNVSKGLISVLRAVCESQGWDCGRYFSLDQASGVLRFTECWGIPTAAVDRFLGESRGMVFRADAGLAGRVVQSGQPLWFAEGSRDEIVPPTALAPETGAEGAFVFPVAADDQTVGVLAFTGCGIREPDDRMLRTVQSIGIQLGRFLESQASLESLRRREMRFRKLTELSADWCWEQDSQFRFTQYAGSGPFDGSGILGKTTWELPNVVLADARWDEHKSQLAARWAFCDFPFVVAHADGTVGNYCISGEPTYDDDGTFTGYCGTGLDMTRHT